LKRIVPDDFYLNTALIIGLKEILGTPVTISTQQYSIIKNAE